MNQDNWEEETLKDIEELNKKINSIDFSKTIVVGNKETKKEYSYEFLEEIRIIALKAGRIQGRTTAIEEAIEIVKGKIQKLEIESSRKGYHASRSVLIDELSTILAALSALVNKPQ